MANHYKEIEEAFEEIKKQFHKGQVSRQEFIDQMKKLRIKDDKGRFWMIGAQTGKWYFFDGKDWIQSDPPTQKEKMAICIYCGFENKLEADVCARCGGNLGEEEYVCQKCGAKLQGPDKICPNCSKGPEEEIEFKEEAVEAVEARDVHIFSSINPVSLGLFAGILGVFCGILLGAFAGATDYFSQGLKFLPPALFDLQGKLSGAIIYAALGSVAGFVIFGALGVIKALLVNLILSLVGGIKITVVRTSGKEKIPPGKKHKEKGKDYLFNLTD
jgi:hypothetical protein